MRPRSRSGNGHAQRESEPGRVNVRGSTSQTLPGAAGCATAHASTGGSRSSSILVFYFVYSAIRNANKAGTERTRSTTPKHIIRWQRALGIYHEETLQDWALHFKPLIIAANYFYGSLHFVVTIAAGIYLFRKFSDDYPRYRNTLAIATLLALIGFKLFPLMPPRSAARRATASSTRSRKYPTFWSFNSGAVSKISNQYAAMPSVHVCWATWCALVFVPRVKHRWAQVLAILYPILTRRS